VGVNVFRLGIARADRVDRSFRRRLDRVDDCLTRQIRSAATQREADELILKRRNRIARLARCWTAGHPRRN
jgi:hypothetical protein